MGLHEETTLFWEKLSDFQGRSPVGLRAEFHKFSTLLQETHCFFVSLGEGELIFWSDFLNDKKKLSSNNLYISSRPTQTS